jgi:hypothetical protein
MHERVAALTRQDLLASMVQREMLPIVLFSVVVGMSLVSIPAAPARGNGVNVACLTQVNGKQ